MLSKFKLFEDVDKIASHMFDGSGNALTSTAGALDVNVASGDLSVDLSHTEDSIALGDGTNLLTSTTVAADIGLDVNLINASIIVTATDLDIRDMSHLQDSMKIGDGVEFMEVNADGSINAVVSATDLDIRNLQFASDSVDVSGSSVTVTATDLDIRDLSHLQDSMKIGDGTDFLAIEADGSINVNTRPAGFASGVYGAQSMTTSAALLTAGTAGRDKVLLQNLGAQSIFIGFDNAVTSSNGIELVKGGAYEMEVGAGVTLYGITGSGTADIRYQELSA